MREIESNLESVCHQPLEPTAKITAWFLALHRAKVTKVLHDPELYKAFDLSTAVQKPFAAEHMKILRRQLIALVKEALAARGLHEGYDPEALAEVLSEALMAFHHPKLVAQSIHEDREPLLLRVLDSVLGGFQLKP